MWPLTNTQHAKLYTTKNTQLNLVLFVAAYSGLNVLLDLFPSHPPQVHLFAFHRVRFARGVKGKNIFTRSQQAEMLNQGVLPGTTSLHQVPAKRRQLQGASYRSRQPCAKYHELRGFPRGKRWRWTGAGVRVKQYMHSKEWNGIGTDGRLDPNAPPHDLFIGHPPRLHNALPYKPKSVPEDVIVKVEQRYQASHDRLAAAYPCGE